MSVPIGVVTEWPRMFMAMLPPLFSTIPTFLARYSWKVMFIVIGIAPDACMPIVSFTCWVEKVPAGTVTVCDPMAVAVSLRVPLMDWPPKEAENGPEKWQAAQLSIWDAVGIQ